MKKYVLVFLVLLLTAAAVTATVLNNTPAKKATKSTKECTYKTGCQKQRVACY